MQICCKHVKKALNLQLLAPTENPNPRQPSRPQSFNESQEGLKQSKKRVFLVKRLLTRKISRIEYRAN